MATKFLVLQFARGRESFFPGVAGHFRGNSGAKEKYSGRNRNRLENTIVTFTGSDAQAQTGFVEPGTEPVGEPVHVAGYFKLR